MKHCDVAIIGGGVLGCFAARNVRHWKLSAVLVEGAEDVCTGISKANTAIIYAGYDNQVGSLKAKMTVAENASFDRLCGELEVPFSRCGSLMVSFGQRAETVLRKKLAQGQQNGVPELRLISGEQARELEPMLTEDVTAALYAPSTGIVNPWKLGIAAYENAVENGCEAMLNTQVLGIRRFANGYVLETSEEAVSCKAVLNCAGLYADKVQEMLFAPSVRLFWDGADFLVFDRQAPAPKYVLFHEPEEKGKGLTAVPTVEGNLMLGPSRRPLEGKPWATTHAGMDFLRDNAPLLLRNINTEQVIRSFASVRPNPHRVVFQNGEWITDGKSIGSFVIDNPAPGFYSLLGIKTPGLTCADALGRYLAQETAIFLDAPKNPAFVSRRKAIHKTDSHVICQCEQITKAEVLEAIARGATTVDGVKRRVGSGMGRCQGTRCSWEIEKLLEDRNRGAL